MNPRLGNIYSLWLNFAQMCFQILFYVDDFIPKIQNTNLKLHFFSKIVLSKHSLPISVLHFFLLILQKKKRNRERERNIKLTLSAVIPIPILVVSEMVHVNKA